MSKELQKITKLTVQILKEENSLAVRGLKDLKLANTPRLKYLAGLYNECVELCNKMESLSAEDCLYWIKSQKKCEYALSSRAHSRIYGRGYFKKYIEAYNQLLKENQTNRADDQYYAYCLAEIGEDKKAIEAFTKALEFYKDIVLSSGTSGGVHLHGRRGDLFYKMGEYKKAINDYLETNHHISVRRMILLAECYMNTERYDAAIEICKKLIPEAIKEKNLVPRLKREYLKQTKNLLDKIYEQNR